MTKLYKQRYSSFHDEWKFKEKDFGQHHSTSAKWLTCYYHPENVNALCTYILSLLKQNVKASPTLLYKTSLYEFHLFKLHWTVSENWTFCKHSQYTGNIFIKAYMKCYVTGDGSHSFSSETSSNTGYILARSMPWLTSFAWAYYTCEEREPRIKKWKMHAHSGIRTRELPHTKRTH